MSSIASEDASAEAGRIPLSVVIPTLNEAARLPALLHQIAAQDVRSEVIVVDGGSADGTAGIARRLGARLLSSPAGRGRQLAAGAAAAQGDALLFLHADSVLPPGALAGACAALDDNSELVGGNFRLLFDGGDRFSHWLNGFYRWIRRHGFYYGDSAIFVRASVYRALGGIRPIALMEDYDFVRRLEKAGPTCCIETPPLVTSARRFHGRHPIPIVGGWLAIHLLFHVGVSPDRLARLYDSARRRKRRPQDPSRTALSDQS
ncbi:MAG: TIGR04283 family arsenosugar biosynthesis glycosyltransferase [Gammaproteobacteria bacterium]|jgi:rSAM/selenodomain-associated transferase 2